MADSRSVFIQLKADVSDASRGFRKVGRSAEAAADKVDSLQRKARRFDNKTYTSRLNLNISGAEKALGRFEKTVKNRLTQAVEDISVSLDVNDSELGEARRKLRDIRLAMVLLSNKRIGIDISAEDALAKTRQLERQLNDVAGAAADVDVQVDARAARDTLSRFRRSLEQVDGKTATAHVDLLGGREVSDRLRRIVGLMTALGPAAVAAAAAVSGAFASMASSAAVAAASIGSIGLAFAGIGDALSAMHKMDLAQRFGGIGRSVSTGDTHVVADARRSLARAQEAAAESIASAQRQLAAARRQAARAIEAAQENVAAATRQLAAAQRQAQRAQEQLTQARREAKRVLQSLHEQVSDLALSERGAVLGLREARKQLHELMQSGTASSLELAQARLAVARAEDRLSDVRRKQAEVTKRVQRIEREGIDSMQMVQDALRNLRQAQREVTQAQRDRQEAMENLAQTQRETSRNIAQAQRQLAEAQEQAAQRIADAQRALQRALHQTTEAMSVTGTEARNLKKAMAQLSPAGREFVRFLDSLRPKLQDLQAVAQKNMFPGLTKAIKELMGLMPAFKKLIAETSESIGHFAFQAAKAFNSPFWRNYIDFLASEAKPTMRAWTSVVTDVTKGLASLQMEMDPLADQWTQAFVSMAEDFKNWATTLENNQGFQEFLDFTRRVGPQVRDTLAAIAQAFVDIAQALAPFSGATLAAIKGLANALSAIAESPIGPSLFAAAAALSALTGALNVFNTIRKSSGVKFLMGLPEMAKRGAARTRRWTSRFHRLNGAVERSSKVFSGFGRNLRRIGRIAGPAVSALALLTLGLHNLSDEARAFARNVRFVEGAATSLADQAASLTARLNAVQIRLQNLQEGGPILDFTGIGKLDQLLGEVGLGLTGAANRAGALKDQIDKTVNSIHQYVGSLGRLAQKFPGVRAALNNFNAAVNRNNGLLNKNGQFNRQVIRALRDVQKAVKQARGTVVTFTGVLRDMNRVLGVGRMATLKYEAALDRARKALKRTNGALNAHTAAGRAAIRAVGGLIDKAIAAINKERALGGSLRSVAKVAVDYTQDIKDLARKTNLSKKATDFLIDKLLKGFNPALRFLIRNGIVPTQHAIDVLTSDTQEYTKAVEHVPAFVSTKYNTPGMQDAINGARELGGLIEQIGGIGAAIHANFDPTPFGGKFLAEGGAVRGSGTATSDSIPARLSNGEHVWTAKEVEAAGGHGAMYAMRQSFRSGYGFHSGGRARSDGRMGFAAGGPVDSTAEITIHMNRLAGTLADITEKLKQVGGRAPLDADYSLFGQMANLVTHTFPHAAISSAFRPGSTTFHGPGFPNAAAVDIVGPNLLKIFYGIARRWGASTRELFYSGAPFQINGGSRLPYPFPNHWDHVHWAASAFDKGGRLEDRGVFTKETLKPERVLSTRQTEAFEKLVEHLPQMIAKPVFSSSSSSTTTHGPVLNLYYSGQEPLKDVFDDAMFELRSSDWGVTV